MNNAGFDFNVYLASVNPVGSVMVPDYESTLMALENTDKQVIVIKPLTAGSLKTTESLFKFIYRYAAVISVGITSETEVDETYSVAKKVLAVKSYNINLVLNARKVSAIEHGAYELWHRSHR